MGDDHNHWHGHGHDHEDSVHKFGEHQYHNHEPPSSIRGASVRERDGPSTTEADLAEARANQRKLKKATTFVIVFFLVEVVGGVWSGSLAIISDAAHLLTDVSGFILAMITTEIASRPACDKLTYGPVRAEVLSALFSTVLILVLSLLLVYSAVWRLIDFSRGEGEEIDGKMMSFIALIGLLVNLTLLGLLGHDHGGHGHDHSHSHGHGGHSGDHNRDEEEEDHDDDHSHHDEEGLIAQGLATNGGRLGERSSLVASTSLNNGGSPVAAESTAGAASIARRNQDQYGSLLLDAEEGETSGATSRGRGDGEVSLKKKQKHKKVKNINMEAAVLHAITDLVQSLGVLLAGLLIWHDPRWKWADPIATLFFVGLVMNSTRWLLKRAFNVLLEGVPDHIDYESLRTQLSDIDGVTDVHCLHVWSLTLGRTVVSAHIKATDSERALTAAHEICEDMGIAHSTIQVQLDHCLPESCTHPCVSAVGRCCGPESGNPSPRSTAGTAGSIPAVGA